METLYCGPHWKHLVLLQKIRKLEIDILVISGALQCKAVVVCIQTSKQSRQMTVVIIIHKDTNSIQNYKFIEYSRVNMPK